MITDQEIEGLSDDADAAFVEFEAIVRASLRDRVAQDTRGWDHEREYVAHILAFVDGRGLPLELPHDPPADDSEFGSWYGPFVRAVDYFKVRTRLSVAEKRKATNAVICLSRDLKTQIGGHIVAIRNIVNDSEASQNKKEAIFRRLANLQEEVDTDRTRTQALMSLFVELTSVIGNAAKNLDPAIERIEKIARIFGRAKAEGEQKTIGAPLERKRIAAPKERPTMDEEIPF